MILTATGSIVLAALVVVAARRCLSQTYHVHASVVVPVAGLGLLLCATPMAYELGLELGGGIFLLGARALFVAGAFAAFPAANAVHAAISSTMRLRTIGDRRVRIAERHDPIAIQRLNELDRSLEDEMSDLRRMGFCDIRTDP